jgi:acetyl esterase
VRCAHVLHEMRSRGKGGEGSLAAAAAPADAPPAAASSDAVLPSDVELAPDVRASLRLMGDLDLPLTRTPLWLSRAIASLAWVRPYLLGPRHALARVRTERHAFGALRYFEPLPSAARRHRRPVTLLYLHGGGFVLCGLDSHHALCASLAAQTGCTVASLDYRLAPEHAAPAPQRDVLRAYQHLLAEAAAADAGGGGGSVGVGGDSAGGNLAASLCLALALAAAGAEAPPFPCGQRLAPLAELAATPQPAFQVLLYPVTNLASRAPSHARYARGWLLTDALREFFWRHYLGPPGAQREALKRHVLLSPLQAAAAGAAAGGEGGAAAARAALRAQCPAVLLTAEHDILHDEGVQYARALVEAGAACQHVEALGLYHGFATATDLATGARAVAELAQRVVALIGQVQQ